MEDGTIVLVGATTENPSFEVISALLSRSRVYALRGLTVPEIVTLLERALPVIQLRATDDLLEQIAIYSNGDGRQAYNTLEAAAAASPAAELTAEAVQDAMQRKVLLYDKGGEEHFTSSARSTNRCAPAIPTPPSTGSPACSKPAKIASTLRAA